MRAIRKGVEPASLTAHRQTPHGSYDNYPDKAELRRALVGEQRGLCCYCMGRVRDDATGMKIEHWRCQRRHRDRELDYRNLLAACTGGEGRRGGGRGDSTATPGRAIAICDGTLRTRFTASRRGCGTSSMVPFDPTTRSSTINSTEC